MDKPTELIDTDVFLNDKKIVITEKKIIESTLIKFDLSTYQKYCLSIKRVFDFLISFIALILLTIPFDVIAIIQKIFFVKNLFSLIRQESIKTMFLLS